MSRLVSSNIRNQLMDEHVKTKNGIRLWPLVLLMVAVILLGLGLPISSQQARRRTESRWVSCRDDSLQAGSSNRPHRSKKPLWRNFLPRCLDASRLHRQAEVVDCRQAHQTDCDQSTFKLVNGSPVAQFFRGTGRIIMLLGPINRCRHSGDSTRNSRHESLHR